MKNMFQFVVEKSMMMMMTNGKGLDLLEYMLNHRSHDVVQHEIIAIDNVDDCSLFRPEYHLDQRSHRISLHRFSLEHRVEHLKRKNEQVNDH